MEKLILQESFSNKDVHRGLYLLNPVKYVASYFLQVFEQEDDNLYVFWGDNYFALEYRKNDYVIYRLIFQVCEDKDLDCMLWVVNNPYFTRSLDFLEKRQFLMSSKETYYKKTSHKYLYRFLIKNNIRIRSLLKSFKKLTKSFHSSGLS